jgi:NitT/TauT family transport system ATP-binding protein
LELERISHSYGQTPVLENVSLRLEPGEVLCLAGPSGCGKTTLLLIAAGLLVPTAGQVRSRSARTACVFQEPRLLPWRTALDNIAFGLKATGTLPKPQQLAVAAALGDQLGLSGSLHKYPHQLSGGMQQRVALARALAVEPDLLLMDEPFASLDVGRRRELQDLLLDLLTERHLAALFVTHDLAEAVRVGDELLVLSPAPGRLVYTWCQARRSDERDDVYVYESVSALLREPPVAASFGTDRFRSIPGSCQKQEVK